MILIFFGLIVLTAAVYYPALICDFVNTDDPLYVTYNFHINSGWNWAELPWCFQAGYASNWHPLTWLSHMLDCQIFGLKPAGHHATNVLLHCLNSGLLFLVLQRLTGAWWRSALVAALFAWHPLHVESVAWISERKDVLCGLFFLLSLWCYAGYGHQTKTSGNRSPLLFGSYWGALVFFGLALLSKPMAVTLPCVLLLLDQWPLNRRAMPEPRSWKCLLGEKTPFLLLSAMVCVITLQAQKKSGAIVALGQNSPFLGRMFNALLSYYRYVKKSFWPAGLVAKYPFDNKISLGELLAAAAFLVLVSVLAVRWRKSRPWWLTGWLWYVGMLVPVIGLVQIGGQAMADRYTYLPLIGLFILITWELCDYVREQPGAKTGVIAVSVTALAACLLLTNRQVSYWKNGGTLFAHTIAVTENNYTARAAYGAWLYQNNQLAEAQAQCEAALVIAPDYAPARDFLGVIFLAEGKLDAAQEQLTKAIERLPALFTAHADLGKVLLAKNLPAKAIEQFTLALQQGFDTPEIHFQLGKALAQQGKLEEARQQFVEQLRQDPGDYEGYFQLGQIETLQLRWPQAIDQYHTALKLQPGFLDALNNLAWLQATCPQAEWRNGPEAVRLAKRACELTKNKDPQMIGTLSAAQAEAGLFSEAVATGDRARDLALSLKKKEAAGKISEMLNFFRSKKPYHEP